MSTTSLQFKPIVVGTPIEIGKAINEIRLKLATLTWINRPFFIAQRFYRKTDQKVFYYPETYTTEPIKDSGGKYTRSYQRLTPDNDYFGMFFFMVGASRNQFDAPKQNYITYPVSIIFSVNLELIDSFKLNDGLFTWELIKEARRILTENKFAFGFTYVLKSETTDLKECYKEFALEDLESYNRAPLQCFRFDLDVTILEDC